MLWAFLILSHFVLQSAQANTIAKNRNDVYQILSKLNSESVLTDLDIWVNEKAQNPTVNIGDTVYFTMQSAVPAFFTFVHVDSKGNSVLIKPETTDTRGRGSYSVVYPPLDYECTEFEIVISCFDADNQLVQSQPIGQDAVFLIASKKPIPIEILGMNESDDFKDLGKELTSIEKLVQQINSQTNDNPISVVKYTYAVESTQTQYTTRSIIKKVNSLATNNDEPIVVADDSLVFNNVNFAFNSSELTAEGRIELDGLGSALVGMQEQLGEIPLIELTGHTDSVGSATYNETLSMYRADSAKQYLVLEHGLPVDAIQIAWKGESEPMETNDTKKGRAMNRRVVLKIPRSDTGKL